MLIILVALLLKTNDDDVNWQQINLTAGATYYPYLVRASPKYATRFPTGMYELPGTWV